MPSAKGSDCGPNSVSEKKRIAFSTRFWRRKAPLRWVPASSRRLRMLRSARVLSAAARLTWLSGMVSTSAPALQRASIFSGEAEGAVKMSRSWLAVRTNWDVSGMRR